MARSTVTAIGTAIPPERRLELAFLPLHKKALGMGIGVAFGLLIFVLTLMQLVRADDEMPLHLLRHYMYGYTVSVKGAFIGMFWAGVAGFVGGWFFAFCRNFALAVSVFIVRTRADLQESRDFLDHI